MNQHVGQVPGSIIHTGVRYMDTVKIDGMIYDSTTIKTFQQFPTATEGSKITWFTISGLHDNEMLKAIGQHYQLHPLTLEDIAHTQQRPKLELFPDYLYLSLRMLSIPSSAEADDVLASEQVSIIWQNKTVLLFQEKEGGLFASVRQRLQEKRGRIRDRDADYLCYALVDTLVDSYFAVLEHYHTRAEELELAILDAPEHGIMQNITQTRRDILGMRRAILPLREMINTLLRDENFCNDEVKSYWRDAYDHTIHIIEQIESLREHFTSLHDMYISSLSHKMNEIMKVLTIISTIFIPLSFLVGLYGMNFEYMPELHYKYSYFILWGIIITLVVLMVMYFKRRDWF